MMKKFFLQKSVCLFIYFIFSLFWPIYQMLIKFIEIFLMFFSIPLGIPFPKDFSKICKNIFKRLTRIFCHVYIHHFDAITKIGAEPHINACFKHFYYFTLEFKLVEEKEFQPLVIFFLFFPSFSFLSFFVLINFH